MKETLKETLKKAVKQKKPPTFLLGKRRPCNQTSRRLRLDVSLRDQRGSGVLRHQPWVTPANANGLAPPSEYRARGSTPLHTPARRGLRTSHDLLAVTTMGRPALLSSEKCIGCLTMSFTAEYCDGRPDSSQTNTSIDFVFAREAVNALSRRDFAPADKPLLHDFRAWREVQPACSTPCG